MVIRKERITIVLHSENKKEKTLRSILGNTIYDHIKGNGLISNKRIILARDIESVTPDVTTMNIDEIFFGSVMYSNGNKKLATESTLMLKNLIDSFSWFEMLHLYDWASHGSMKDLTQLISAFKSSEPEGILSYELIDLLNARYGLPVNIKNENVRSVLIDNEGYTKGIANYGYNGELKTRLFRNYPHKIAKLQFFESVSGLDKYDIGSTSKVPIGLKLVDCDDRRVSNYFCEYGEYIIKNPTFTRFNVYSSNYARHFINRFDNIMECASCGGDMHEIFNNISSEADSSLCRNCHADELSKSIRSYGYKPNARFFDVIGDNVEAFEVPNEKANIGIEVEIEKRSHCSINEMYNHAKKLNDFNDGIFYCKEDSSIGADGFEIVSHPMTFKAVRKLNWDDSVFSLNDDFRAFHTEGCGMHIHISREAFNDLTFHKFALMINTYQNFTHFISQRRNLGEYQRWAKFDTEQIHRAKKEASQKYRFWKSRKQEGSNRKLSHTASTYSNTRYQVINDTNSATIEIRCFKANISKQGFLKNIEFVEAMYNFCKESSNMDMRLNKFIQYVRNDKKYYSNLNQYFIDNRNTMKSVTKHPYTLENINQ